ncbi:YveK family protein [Butyrivibrio sp. WCD3002]|uniref:YveK family protein n=1 Tax=Butyrivibrio sp. WCD3002 TaxID=1280676 RepID=UPI00047A5252|nr:Wzz/FepE/Etk N-terminal domain-containing protein [Butyrivibrio sp. WCD3002]
MYKNLFEIDIIRCCKVLYKKAKFILLIAVLFFVAGFAFTLDIGEDQYTARATVYAAPETTYNDAANAVTAMNAYLDVASSYKVCQRAALIIGRSDFDANDIQEAIGVTSSSKSTSNTIISFMATSATIITFAATTNDPELSIQVADAMAKSYTIEMTEILSNKSVKLLDNADSADMTRNASRSAWKKRLLAMFAGFVLACFVIVITEIFDNRVRSIRDATIRHELPVLGIIPENKH